MDTKTAFFYSFLTLAPSLKDFFGSRKGDTNRRQSNFPGQPPGLFQAGTENCATECAVVLKTGLSIH